MGWIDFEVQCGFGGGEETTRFGPRQEIGSTLYQVDTVACVNNSNDVSQKKFVNIFRLGAPPLLVIFSVHPPTLPSHTVSHTSYGHGIVVHMCKISWLFLS